MRAASSGYGVLAVEKPEHAAAFEREFGRKATPVVVGKPITTWARDRFVARADGSLVVPPEAHGGSERRRNDAFVPIVFAGRMGRELGSAPFRFDGGDFLATDGRLIASSVWARRNRDRTVAELVTAAEKLFGQPVVYLPEAPEHHVGMAIAPVGKGRLLVGDARRGARLCPDDADTDRSERTAAIFHFAPAEERLRAAIEKERQVPRFLAEVRRGLVPTAPILVQYGLRGTEGALSLVKKDLPVAFEGVGSQALRAEFEEATRTAGEALERHATWLRRDMPAGPEKAYALGEERYAGWLRAAERVTTPLPELEWWALAEIEAARRGIQEEAARLKPGARPADVVAAITADHPPTGRVVAEARRIAEEVHAWVRAKDLVTFPTDTRVRIDDTPDFMRWSFGSMWSPGPFEKAEEVVATFYATDADPAWPPEKQNEHLTAFCHRGLENLAIHEAYPGHFVQNMHQIRVGSLVRKAFWWGVFGEGWAHYTEQLAVEEGFGGDAPKARGEVHIVQLQEALARLCRFVNGIRLHTRPDWDFDRGTRFFVEEAWVAEAVARAECERGAFDPFYLRYALGKKEILELRDECQKALGAEFNLRKFHDALLGCGSGPMESMRALTKIALGI